VGLRFFGTATARAKTPSVSARVPQLYDSRDRHLGPLLEPDVVAVRIILNKSTESRWFALYIKPSGFFNPDNVLGLVELFFESDDCTGTPYMAPRSDSLIEQNFTLTSAGMLFFPSTSIVQKHAGSSAFSFDGESPSSVCSQGGSDPTEMVNLSPVESIDLSQQGWAAPFTIK
jgi:hypothetical protein